MMPKHANMVIQVRGSIIEPTPLICMAVLGSTESAS
jgi:hypothetical protein